MKSSEKIISRSELGKISEARRDKTLVFTNGCFDILHPGHFHLLNTARKMGHLLVVGVNSDDSVSRIKGPSRPVNKQNLRMENLADIPSVDFIIIFDEDTPERLIKELRPDVLVKGSDYKIKEIVGQDFVKSYGGQVRRVPLLKGHSTTRLIEKFKKK